MLNSIYINQYLIMPNDKQIKIHPVPDQKKGRITTPPPQPKPETGRITTPPPKQNGSKK